MSTVDSITLDILGVFGLICLVLMLIPGFADALKRAVQAIRESWREINGQSAKEPPQEREKEEQRQP